MVPTVVLGVLVLLAAIVFYLIERRGHRQGARATTSVLVEQKRNACAASYLRESIATSLVHEPHHPGYSGRRR
jgi:peptidoglycan/LPS O-acetylase OafA/YrhL